MTVPKAMKPLAWIVALMFMAIGSLGVVAPDALLSVAQHILTPGGFYAIAALRIGMGVVLILVAPASRAPRTLRAFGAVVLVAGLATPLLGVDRAQEIAAWAAGEGPALVRGAAGAMLVIGGFIAWAVSSGRRT